MKSWAKPIHSPVDSIFDGRVPGAITGQGIWVINNIQGAVAVLESSKVPFVSIANSKDQIACSSSCLHPVNGLFDLIVPLEHISKHKSEGISESTLFAKSLVWIWHSNFWNCHFMLIDSRKNSNPSHESDVYPGIPIFRIWRMIYHCYWIFSIRPIKILN